MTLSLGTIDIQIQRHRALEELARSFRELLEAVKTVRERKVRNEQAGRNLLNSVNESKTTLLDAARRLTELGDVGDVAKTVLKLYPDLVDDLKWPDDSGNDR